MAGQRQARRAAEAKARSEAILRAVVHQSPIAIYALDEQGRTVLWNRAAEDLFGVAEVDMLGRTLPFVEPDGEDVINRLLARVFDGETIRGLEATRPRADGSEVEVNLSAAPVRDADGNVVMAIGVIADITDRKHAEEARRRGEERLRTLVTHASDMVVVYDIDGRVQYASPSAGRWGGYDPDEITGEPLERSHPDDRPQVIATMTDVISNGGTSAPLITRVRHADGSWRWVEIVFTNLLDDPSVGGIVTNARDVTERVEASEQLRNAYEQLRQSNETLRAVFENAPLAIYAFDAEGIIQVWSPACEAVFGFDADETIGHFSPLVRDEDMEVAADLRTRVMAGEVVQPVEARRLHKDGREIDVMFATAPMRDEDGNVVACLAMSSDISAQKEHERALRENEARFRALAEHASVIITILEADGTLRYTSPSAQSILGYPEGFAEGGSAFDFVHPDEVEQVVDLYQETVSKPGLGEPVQFRMRHHDGSYRLMEAVGNNLLDDPDVRGVVMTARDMTQQFEAEEALRRSEARFRAMVQNLSDIVSIVDADGTLRWASPAVERVLGYSATEGPPYNPMDSIHPADRPRVEQAVAALDRGVRLEPISFRVRHADGSWRSVESVFDDLREDPSVGGLVVTSRDVTEKREAESRLAESESRYRGIVEDQTELICRFRRDGTLTFVNGAYARYFGKQVDALMGTNFAPFIPDDDRPRVARVLAALGPENPVMTVEHRVVAPDGSLRWQQWTNRVVLDERGNIVEYQAVGRDVTQQREAEGLVSDQARILETIARGAPLPETLAELCRVVETHAPAVTCSVLLVNDDGATLRHGAAPSLPDTFVRALDSIPIGPRAGSSGTAAYLGESVVVTDIETDPLWSEHRSIALSHGLRACWATPIRAASDEHILGTFALYFHERRSPSRSHERLVEMVVHLAAIAIDRKRFETKLAHQAHHDPLTGLPNRVLFLEFLVLALARARRYRSQVAVLFMDLDRFKVVNDSLGHDAGDELLVGLSERLRSVLRPGDTVARFGGDEFVILCEDLSGPEAKQQAVEVAERLLDVIQQPFHLDGDEHFLSASIGIALAVTGDDRPEALLRDADAAMYRAKDRGKGRWELFDETMRVTAMVRLETENALHRAIDRGEFRLFYQPVMSIADGSCTGVEALVRWQYPNRGLVAPHEFIQLAEETGLVIPLGGWVLSEACRQAARWHAERLDNDPFQVAVNLSARQLAHPDLVDSVDRALKATGADPSWLCLEITESVLMDDVDATIGAVKRLKGLGVDLAIDDFGTGYSSLGYLKRFPVDLVKVDRSFVDGLGSDPEDSAIVAAVVSLGHALGLRVVAEGVETEQQLSELVALECDLAQGYFFAPPQPAVDIEDLVLGPRRASGFGRLRRSS